MSEQRLPEELRTPSKWPRIAMIVLLVIVCLWFFLPLIAWHLEILSTLLFGWFQFIKRTMGRISWNWDLVLTGLVCSIFILLLAHVFMTWLTRTMAAVRGRDWRWPWKWTCCGLLGIFLLFIIGMSVGGAVHQIGWMASTQESWYERRGGYSSVGEMKQLELALKLAMDDSGGDVTQAGHLLKMPKNEYLNPGSAPIVQRYHLLVILKDDQTMAGHIVFPRNYRNIENVSAIYEFGQTYEIVSGKKLRALIEKHQEHLLAL